MLQGYINNKQRIQMFRKICPCVAWVFSKSGPSKKGYQYEPRSELQQEQFMHKLQAETKHSIASNQLMSEQLPIQQQISNELGLSTPFQKTIEYSRQPSKQPPKSSPQPPSTSSQPKPVPQPPAQKPQLQHQHQHEGNGQPENEHIIQQQDPQQTKSYGFTNLGQLVLNIPQYGQNYQILKQKCHGVAQLLDISQNCTEVALNSKSKINKTKLRVWRKANNNCFIVQYELPCSYAFYTEFMNKKITINENNKLFKQSKLVQSIHQNLTQKYLCLNKIGMLQPRQFNYLKYTNNSSTNPSGHWQLCISKDTQQPSQSSAPSSPQNKATKSGKLFSVSYVIEQKKQSKIEIKVRTYVSLDVGVTVEKVWERLLGQLRNYIEEVWEEAANNYAEELV